MGLVTVLFVLAVVVVVAWTGIAAWVVRDAAAAGAGSAAKWGMTVLCTGPAGLVAYLAVGSPGTAARR
ncbi:hypothetical protein [Halorubellus sp. PRR65]|uniref:hypothetical protein n=1 Tax=Halorubellus sp. PRR65 TaxID=3098148 RepID=UPI002B262249|nr:hypothetical protein [Halorubellus sp. PRR65]